MQETQGTRVQFPGRENPTSSVLAWKNAMDRGAWWAAVHGVTESQTWLNTQAHSARLTWKWKSLSGVQLFATPWDFPDQNTGVGSHSLLQGIFPTRGSNPGLPHCRRVLYQLSHKGSPLELWVTRNLVFLYLCFLVFVPPSADTPRDFWSGVWALKWENLKDEVRFQWPCSAKYS